MVVRGENVGRLKDGVSIERACSILRWCSIVRRRVVY